MTFTKVEKQSKNLIIFHSNTSITEWVRIRVSNPIQFIKISQIKRITITKVEQIVKKKNSSISQKNINNRVRSDRSLKPKSVNAEMPKTKKRQIREQIQINSKVQNPNQFNQTENNHNS